MSIRARRNNGFQNVDLQTLSYYLGLVVVGWMMIIAATAKGNDFGEFSSEATKQGFFIIVSFVLIVGVSFIEWKFWRTFSYIFYALSILSLIAVLIIGKKVSGATSWFSIGGFSLQPSEFAKFATCLAMASFLSSYNANLRIFKSQVIAFGLIAIPIILILLQPDAGSAIVFTSFLILFYRLGLSENFYIIFLTITALFIIALIYKPYYVILGFMTLGTGIFIFNIKNERQKWAIGFALLIIATILGLYFFHPYYREIFVANVILIPIVAFNLWRNGKKELVKLLLPLIIFGGTFAYGANFAFNNILKPHQQSRINVWLNPSKAPSDAIYNLRQSKLTIGSGELSGKGFLQGTRTKLDFVPVQSTDFIFCTIGEEQGFIGVFGIIVLYLLFLYRITVIAERQRSDFSRNYAYGVAGILFFHFFINIGMTMGLVMIIGIPLPFISYGGSSLLAFSLMIGVLLKLDSNRFSI
ncbi:MAG: rod shape-determining protein RodA [Saprospiraceae bacterium]